MGTFVSSHVSYDVCLSVRAVGERGGGCLIDRRTRGSDVFLSSPPSFRTAGLIFSHNMSGVCLSVCLCALACVCLPSKRSFEELHHERRGFKNVKNLVKVLRRMTLLHLVNIIYL